LGLGLLECAAGVQEVADSLMEDKIRSMTVARGHDPREFVLYAFGGGGAVHAGLFARGLGISRVVVPVGDLASVWSAYGIGLEGYGRTYELPAYMRAPFEPATIVEGFEKLDRLARDDAARSGVEWGSLVSARSADLKYALQVYDVEAEVPDGTLGDASPQAIVDNFERNYARRFGEGVGYPEGGVEVTALRLHVEPADSLRAGAASAGGGGGQAEPAGSRDVYWPEQREVVATPVYTGAELPEGSRLTGPALLDFPDTTVVVRPGLGLVVESGGNLTIEMED
ncbi:MAG TPA: hydantoinase/oxoprolinase family protein, partial [Solirubrobacterales bacterium]|nr:hydantoinase/oxoprolinase family protein [Solirubrobacterales bacterium]